MGHKMDRNIIEINNVSHTYRTGEAENAVEALFNINIKIKESSFVVVLGRNGSGKSTLAKLINGLILPTKGSVIVNGMDTRENRYIWDIRSTVGMVFQNPDNQIIGTTVEEDVAFGPENLGIPPSEIVKRVRASLEMVGLKDFSESAPHLLSGGQKQRVAIAGILAMRPRCIVLDEATSMLDPIGRKEVMNILKKLNEEEKITIVHITHNMDEAFLADRVIVINDGIIEADGTPQEIFSMVDKIKEFGLDVPQVTELLYELERYGYELPKGLLTIDEAYDVLKPILQKKSKFH